MFRTEVGDIFMTSILYIVITGTLKNTANHGLGLYTSYDAL